MRKTSKHDIYFFFLWVVWTDSSCHQLWNGSMTITDIHILFAQSSGMIANSTSWRIESCHGGSPRSLASCGPPRGLPTVAALMPLTPPKTF